MSKLKIYFILIIALMLLNSCSSSGQLVKTHSLLNQHDSKGLKTGQWIEYDTIANIKLTLYNVQGEKISPNDDVSHTHTKYDTAIAIIEREGNYRLGKPDGVWRYKINDTLTKEITYQEGLISKAKIFADGKLQYSGYANNTNQTFIYEQFDGRNKKIASGSVPFDLLQIESNN